MSYLLLWFLSKTSWNWPKLNYKSIFKLIDLFKKHKVILKGTLSQELFLNWKHVFFTKCHYLYCTCSFSKFHKNEKSLQPSVHETVESDSEMCMTPGSQTLQCAWNRGVRLCGVHEYRESDSAVRMKLWSQTLRCAWYRGSRLCGAHESGSQTPRCAWNRGVRLWGRVGHPFFSKEWNDLCVLFRSL